ncbi:MAG: deoxyribodipyrimidine photo-lyase [Pseudomonadota bacterium]
MTEDAPIIWWVRRDLRMSDNEALSAAANNGAPVIPVFIRDAVVDATGAAAKWRWGEGLGALDAALRKKGSQLILRTGDPLAVLRDLVQTTGARAVHWSRAYDPDSIARDKVVKAGLKGAQVGAESFPGHVLFEPWTVQTKAGGHFKVYTPMWRAVSGRDVPDALPVPHILAAPATWPPSETLTDWKLGAGMDRGAAIVARYACVGEHEARLKLDRFLRTGVAGYRTDRDFPALEATSRLSENLAFGEISPRQVWHAGRRAAADGAAGAEHFVKEVVWREFAYHLLYHEPTLATENHRKEWDNFAWRGESDDADAWRRGLTGCEMVDAAMRELYVTGTMHNRLRMLAGSYLTKHLFTDWRIGRAWFEDCLIDGDPASNAMGWQWIAGCGPDAAPYFRIFNPDTQADKFDGNRDYRDLFLKGGNDRLGGQPAQDFFDAVPLSWGLSPDDPRPAPRVDLRAGRERALAAYADLKN